MERYLKEEQEEQSQQSFLTLLNVSLLPKRLNASCIDVVVQFYPWFNFYFPFFSTHYHTLPYTKTKEIKLDHE